MNGWFPILLGSAFGALVAMVLLPSPPNIGPRSIRYGILGLLSAMYEGGGQIVPPHETIK